MVLGSFTSVFAADYDLINNHDSSKNTDLFEFFEDPDTFMMVANDFDNYELEYNEKLYSVNEIEAKLKAGAKDLKDAIKQIDEDNSKEELEVVEISAINPTTIKVVFSEEVPAELLDVTNFTLSKGTVEAVTATGAEVKLNVKGLVYGDEVTVTVVEPAFAKEVIVPAVSEVFKLEIVTDAENDTIKSDGAEKTMVTVTLIDRATEEVVEKDGVVQFQTTDGGLGQTTSSLVKGKASVQLTSIASPTSVTAILTATISDAPGAQEFKGLTAQKAIIFSPNPAKEGELKFVSPEYAESTQGDRFFVQFSGKINASDFIKEGGLTKVKINGKYVKLTDVVQETENTLLFILEVDKKTSIVRIENGWAVVDDNYLRDNVQHQLEFDVVGNLVYSTSQPIKFIMTDTSRPAVLGVESDDQLNFHVRFTESMDYRTAVNLVNYRLDGKEIIKNATPSAADVVAAKNANKVIVTDLKQGVYAPGKDERNRVYFTMHKDFALAEGEHIIQIANVRDWAGDVDPVQNTMETDTFDFKVVVDNTIPNPTIIVQSPEQWRIDFDKKVYGVTGSKTIEDVFKIESADSDDSFDMDTDYMVSSINKDGSTGTKLNPAAAASTLNGEQYFLIEFLEDWTVKYDTANNPLKTYFASTKNPYTVTLNNLESLVGTKMGERKLDVSLSYDGVSPEIEFAKQIGKTQTVEVEMTEPVKEVNNNVGSLKETNTPSQQQAALTGVPVPTYEFVKGDKVVEGVALAESYDNYSFVLKPKIGTLDAGEWTLYIRSISDDIGNTSATVSTKLIIEAPVATETDTQIAWAAFDDAGGVNKLLDDPTLDKDVIYIKFTKVMKSSGVNGVARTQNYVFMGQSLAQVAGEGAQVNRGIKGVTNDWDGVTITMPKGTWDGTNSGNDFTVALNIASNFESVDGVKLSGDYEVELYDTSTISTTLDNGFEAIYLGPTDIVLNGSVAVKAVAKDTVGKGYVDEITLTADQNEPFGATLPNILVNGVEFESTADDGVYTPVTGDGIKGTATDGLKITTLDGAIIFNTEVVEDKAIPTIIKAVLTNGGKTLTLTFSEAVTKVSDGTFQALEDTDFDITTVNITAVQHEEDSAHIVVLTLDNDASGEGVNAETSVLDFEANAADATNVITLP